MCVVVLPVLSVHMNPHNTSADCQTVPGGVTGSRLNYNKKAMDEIRLSLQSYHVTSSYDNMSSVAATVSSNSGNATIGGDGVVRRCVLSLP